jgi:hypothetical protein
VLIILAGIKSTAQQTLAPDSVYGLDPWLYNGKLYNPNVFQHAKGNPYFMDKQFVSGSIKINNIIYPRLELNYDIYNQKLLLNYTDLHGATQIIEISPSWLQAFIMSNYTFRLIRNHQYPTRIYQVLEGDSVSILYYWKKDYKLDDTFTSGSTYAFSEPIRIKYVKIGDELYGYKNNREFVKSFDVSVQMSVNKYLKNNRIKVKKAPDKTMMAFLQFYHTLK